MASKIAPSILSADFGRIAEQIAAGARNGASYVHRDVTDGRFVPALVMSVNPGFGGQRFIPHALEKLRETRALRERCGVEFEIEVDGGITLENARSTAEAGADVIVIGSAIFDTPDCGRAMKQF